MAASTGPGGGAPPGYRTPSPPAGRVFRMELDPEVRRRLGVALLVLATTVLLFVASRGRIFVCFFVGAGFPALLWLFGGVPRAVVVHHDRVVVRYALRPPVVLAREGLRVASRGGSLELATEDRVLTLDARHFADGERAALEAELRAGTAPGDTGRPQA